MKQSDAREYRPRSRRIAVGGYTAIIGLMLAAFALFHSSQVDTIQTSYINRIASLESEIRALETSNKLDSRSAGLLKEIFSELRAEQSESKNYELLLVVLGIFAVSFLLIVIVAYVIVIRNRKAVTSAFEEGYRKGALAQRTKGDQTEPVMEVEEDLEEDANEFIKNYVQKGGE